MLKPIYELSDNLKTIFCINKYLFHNIMYLIYPFCHSFMYTLYILLQDHLFPFYIVIPISMQHYPKNLRICTNCIHTRTYAVGIQFRISCLQKQEAEPDNVSFLSAEKPVGCLKTIYCNLKAAHRNTYQYIQTKMKDWTDSSIVE